jgi:hypothetical protein
MLIRSWLGAATLLFLATSAANAGCLSIDRSNSLSDTWVNHCNVTISVYWVDQGFCDTGCGDTVGPGRRSGFTKLQGRSQYWECQGVVSCKP